MATTGVPVTTVTADAGYAYAKVYGALERRGIDALIPTKAEPIRSPVPLRRFRYDAKHDIVKCPRGKILRPGNPVAHGRFFYARKRDCDRCALASICLSKGRSSKGLVISHDYPALLRARRRRERWSAADQRLYQRHRWRSEGFHGEAKTWHGLARAVRRGLQNMRIQAYLTASAINLKRLAAACQWRRDFRPVRRRKTRPRQAIAGKVCDQRFSRLCGRMSPQLGGGSAASSAVARVRVAWFSTAPAARARRPFECVRR
jgi:hypothetical protein